MLYYLRFFLLFINLIALSASVYSDGQKCFNDISNCDLSFGKNLTDLIDFLYKKGGVEFQSGAFIIVDPGFKLLEKLKDFVKKEYKNDLCKEELIANTKAYPRKSTHLINYYIYNNLAKKDILGNIIKNCDVIHYGIDIKENTLHGNLKYKKHILFGKVGTIDNQDLIFIKPEEAGLYGLDALKHTIDLLSTKAKKIFNDFIYKISKKLGSKQEAEEIAEITSFESSNVDRKERMPIEIMESFLDIDGIVNDKDIQKKVSAYGIQEMVKVLEKNPSEKGQKLLELIKDRYPRDYSMRFGNEIIIKIPSTK